jgi:hypothetical protein
LTLVFGESSVTVSGVAPKATIYLYSLAREPKGYVSNVVAHDTRLSDDDGDGRAVWAFEKPLAQRSFWLAVELDSGRYVAGTPEAYTNAERIDLTASHLKKDSAGEVQQLSAEGGMIEFVAVRPKDGSIWSATVTSLGTSDEGKEHGKVTLSAARLLPRGNSADGPPKSLRKDDVVLIVNSFTAQYGVARVGDWR